MSRINSKVGSNVRIHFKCDINFVHKVFFEYFEYLIPPDTEDNTIYIKRSIIAEMDNTKETKRRLKREFQNVP